MELSHELDSAASARHALEDLEGGLPPDQLGDVRLLVSELMTNAIRHADLDETDAIRLALAITPAAVRVEVHDPDTGFDLGDAPTDPDRSSGWGLFLVETLTDRWGIERRPGTHVWFELDRVEGDGRERGRR